MRAGLGCLVVLAFLVGCSGDSDDDVPQGFRAYRGEGFELATPRGWERTSGDERLNPKVDAEFVPSGDESDAPPQILVSATRARPGQTVETYVTFTFGVGQFEAPDSEIVDRGPVDVPGAEEAVRLEFSYLEDRIADPVRIRSWSVVARAGRRFYDLRLASPEDEFDERLFERVIDTFEVDT